jgi:hypothetical protein
VRAASAIPATCPFISSDEVDVRVVRLTAVVTVAAATLAMAGCGGKDSSGPPGGAASLVAGSGGTPSGQVNTVLGTSLTFIVRDAAGAAIAGVPVTIAVTAGGGTLTGKPTVSAAGETSIGSWTLGTVAGTQTVTVTVSGLTPLVLSATATPGPPAGMNIAAGNAQTALAGAAVAAAVQARVVDGFGNAIPSQAINWTVVEGNGTFTGSASTTSNGAGLANAPTWTLGREGGPQRIRAASGSFETFATATIQTAYTLDLRWATTPPTGATLDAFTRAVNRIRAAVVGGVTPVGMPTGFNNVSQCPGGPTNQPNFTETSIPGVIIYASVGPDDGVGGRLGSAGPCLIRPAASQYKTALGLMRFDEADLPALVANGRLDAVILHEMLHVIGFGTIWTNNTLLDRTDTTNVRYTGARARAACAMQNGGPTTCASTVPVHSSDGAGSRDSHWRESVFLAELMTPFIGTGASPFAAMTIESLGDMGYSVNLGAADPYTVTAGVYEGASLHAAAGAGSAAHEPTRMPDPILPAFTIDTRGRLLPIRSFR